LWKAAQNKKKVMEFWRQKHGGVEAEEAAVEEAKRRKKRVVAA
jgi:hypothetical protein